MRYFEGLFGESALYLYLCRRIYVIITIVLSHKARMRYVYIRKRKLDKLPLGHFSGVTPSGESIPYAGLALRQVEFVGF